MNSWIKSLMLSSDEDYSVVAVSVMLSVLLALSVLLGLSGFFTMGTDLWDGTIVAHAITTDRPDVYREWFREAGLFFTPYIYDVLYWARGIVRYELLAKFCTVLFLCLSSIELGRLVRRYYSASPSAAGYTAILFFLSPAWVLYYSSIYLMHSFSLFLTLICTRYIMDRRLLWLALPILLLSFQQSSNAPLAISLILLGCVCLHSERKELIVNFGFIFFIILGFFFLRELFPTYGLYAGYNKINISNLFEVRSYLSYLKYFLVLYAPFFVFILVALFLTRDMSSVKRVAAVVAGIMLNGVAYIAVGKLPSLYEIGLMHAESLRFTFTSTVFASLLFPVFWQALSSYPRTRFYASVFLMCYVSALGIYAHKGKMKEVLFQRGMVAELKEISNLPECVINIKSAGVTDLTIYEYGNIFFRAYGKVAYLPLGNSSDPVLESKEAYKSFFKESYKYKYFLPQLPPACFSELHVKTELSQWGFFTTIFHFFSGDNSGIVTIDALPLQ